MQCPKCNSEIKTIQAGVSKKTGKPYESFQVCSDRNCGYILPKPQNRPAPPATFDNLGSILLKLDGIQKTLEQIAKNTTPKEDLGWEEPK